MEGRLKIGGNLYEVWKSGVEDGKVIGKGATVDELTNIVARYLAGVKDVVWAVNPPSFSDIAGAPLPQFVGLPNGYAVAYGCGGAFNGNFGHGKFISIVKEGYPQPRREDDKIAREVFRRVRKKLGLSERRVYQLTDRVYSCAVFLLMLSEGDPSVDAVRFGKLMAKSYDYWGSPLGIYEIENEEGLEEILADRLHLYTSTGRKLKSSLHEYASLIWKEYQKG